MKHTAMKKVLQHIPYLLAGGLGGLAVLGGLWIGAIPHPQAADTPPVHVVNVPSGKNAASQDFVLAASVAMPAVVHIKASESDQLARVRHQQERMRNPWAMFEDEIFFGYPGRTQRIQRKEGSGSGVIFSQDGYIVTNNHVIEFADQFEITLFDNRKFRAELVGADPKTDLAVLKIEAKGLPILRVGDSDQAQVGEWVLAVGNPLNLTSTVTAGIISAKGRNIDIIRASDAIEAFIQTDAAVNPGNSGGALVDVQGRLIGINTAIATRTGYYNGYSFAIPSNRMRRIVEDIITQGYSQGARMGLTLVELDGDLAAELKLPFTQGLIISELEPGGSAEKAGLQPFDVILEANGKALRNFPELQEQISQIRPGEGIRLQIYRQGKYQRVQFNLR